MSLANDMPAIREKVWERIGDVATIGTSEVRGKFFKRYREIQLPDGSVSALDLSFDCNTSADILALEEDDEVVVEGETYKFLRRVPATGDESGLVTLELKR